MDSGRAPSGAERPVVAASGAPRIFTVVDRWIVPLWIVTIAVWQAGWVHEGDPYWQIRAGAEVLDGMPLIRPDSWSWAPVPGDWVPNSPLWNIVLALGYHAFGFWGMFVVGALSIGSCLGLIALLSRHLGAGTYATLGAMLVVSFLGLSGLSPRAALVAVTMLLAGIWWADWWGVRASSLRPWLAGVLTLVVAVAWSALGGWVHIAWATYWLLLAAAWAVQWWLAPLPRWRRSLLIGTGTVGLALGSLLGPYGIEVWSRSRRVADMTGGYIKEWRSPLEPSLIGTRGIGAIFAAVGVVVALGWVWRRMQPGRTRALLGGLIAAGLPLAVAGLVFIRFSIAAVFVLGPVLAWALGGVAAAIAGRNAQQSGWRRVLARAAVPDLWRVVSSGVWLGLLPFIAFPIGMHAVPGSAVVLDDLPRACRLVSSAIDAAPVILLRPDVTVWVDGRADYWGKARTLDNTVPPGATCALAEVSNPSSPELVRNLEADPAWVVVGERDGWRVWVRTADSMPGAAD